MVGIGKWINIKKNTLGHLIIANIIEFQIMSIYLSKYIYHITINTIQIKNKVFNIL